MMSLMMIVFFSSDFSCIPLWIMPMKIIKKKIRNPIIIMSSMAPCAFLFDIL